MSPSMTLLVYTLVFISLLYVMLGYVFYIGVSIITDIVELRPYFRFRYFYKMFIKRYNFRFFLLRCLFLWPLMDIRIHGKNTPPPKDEEYFDEDMAA